MDEIVTGEVTFEYKLPDGLKDKYPKSKGVFTIGEELEIKGSLFKVKDISAFGIKLKLLRQVSPDTEEERG